MGNLSTLYERFGGECTFCDRRLVMPPGKRGAKFKLTDQTATRDHAIPRSRGGTLAPENTLLACRACNEAKSNMTDLEFRSFLKTGKLPMSYIRYLAERIHRRVRTYIPHAAKPVE